MTRFFFDTPWWFPTSIAVVGAILFITGNNRQEFRIRTAGLIIFLLAPLLAALSYFVDTNLEKAEKGSRRLVEAVEKRDWPVFQQLLDPRASVAVQNAGTVADNREEIVSVAQIGVEQFGLKTATITSLDSREDHSRIIITIDAITLQDSFQYPLPSTWQFEWVPTANGVQVVRITNLKIGQDTGVKAQSKFPTPRN